MFFECHGGKCEPKSFFRERIQKYCISNYHSEALEEPDKLFKANKKNLLVGEGSWVLGCRQSLSSEKLVNLNFQNCKVNADSPLQIKSKSPFHKSYPGIISEMQIDNFKSDFLGAAPVQDPDQFKRRLMQFSRQRESTMLNTLNERHHSFTVQFLILLILPSALSFVAMVGLGSFRANPLLSWTALLLHALCYGQVLLVRDYTQGGFSFGLAEVDELLFGISYASFFGFLIMTSIRTGLSFSRRRPKQNP